MKKKGLYVKKVIKHEKLTSTYWQNLTYLEQERVEKMREALVHLAPRFALRGGVSKQRGFQICTPPQSFTLLDKVEDFPSTLSLSNKKYAFCIIAPSSYLTEQGDHREKIIFFFAGRRLQKKASALARQRFFQNKMRSTAKRIFHLRRETGSFPMLVSSGIENALYSASFASCGESET